ncbi:uncharacterized protein LOC135143328 isoform X2 [Zophobas morio]|uniref:uncharacterized protein LOC135143328 isoform X2 n=1 Tax=Zophobas morio TaxID=2755281 RepID=UPI003083A374
MESDNEEDGGALTSNVVVHERCVPDEVKANSSQNNTLVFNRSTYENVDTYENEEYEENREMFVKKPTKRTVWSKEEIAAIRSNFNSFIKKKIYPSGETLKEFLKIET